MDEKKKNSKTIFFVILGTLVLVAAIITTTIFVSKANSVSGQIIGTWKDPSSSYTITFGNFGNATISYKNTKFVLNSASENEAKTDEVKIDGSYSIDENNGLNINIKGVYDNQTFSFSDKAKENKDFWYIEENNLYLNGKKYIK